MQPLDRERLLHRFATPIQRTARLLHKRIGDPSLDNNDYAQELRLHVYRRLDRYDATRGPLDTFVLWQIRGKAKMLLRGSLAKRTLFHRSCSRLDSPSSQDDSASTLLRDTIADPRPPQLAFYERRLDVEQALATLSATDGHVCSLMRSGLSQNAAASRSGLSRKRVASSLRAVRARLRSLGIAAYL